MSTEVLGQASVRKLSTVINHPSLNVSAPYISADGNALVFLTDNAEDNALTPFYSFRDRGDWKMPQALPKNVHTRLNFLRGYGLSADGSTLFFSTLKSPGVGGFDIWISEWKGAWTNPVNPGAPINSRQHEACASLSADGKTMYFMRCEKMDQFKAESCKILRIDKRPNGTWGEPVELPSHINTGNSQAPRIMADGETLIFSSDKMGGKGGMDLFVTRLKDGTWSTPVALDFANTGSDDQYVAVNGLGRYLIKETPGARKSELVEYLIPGHLRPRGVTKVDGRVAGPDGKPVSSYLSLVDTQSGQRAYNGRPNSDGTFMFYAMEGARYELSVDPEHGEYTYFSHILDLTQDPIPQVEKVQALIRPVQAGDQFELSGVSFNQITGELEVRQSERELQRLARLASSNPRLQFRIEVAFEGYQQDSLRSNPELTEIRMDTIPWKYVDIDTMGQLYKKDTFSIKTVYHNDRTVRQAQQLLDQVVAKGAKGGNVVAVGTAIPAVVLSSRRTTVRVSVINR